MGAAEPVEGTKDWNSGSAMDRSTGKLGGVWCFRGTRVRVAALIEHLGQRATIDECPEWFPAVGREQVHEVLSFLKSSLKQPSAAALDQIASG